MNKIEVEIALDEGRLKVLMGNGNWWRARRNGKTRTWKRDPKRFVIPIKAGLDRYANIDNANIGDDWLKIDSQA